MVDEVRYSFVVPVYNEAEVLPLLLARLDTMLNQLDSAAEVIFVNDGSRDASLGILRLKAKEDHRYRILNLSRNFGHQVAITAGLDNASGEAVVVMDADLQDPPEVVFDMIDKWKSGWDVVSGKRTKRKNEGILKRLTAFAFYRILSKLTSVEIQEDVGDFRLLDRKVVNAFKLMREQDRFVRGMISWLGFKQTFVEYTRQGRAAGVTKYPFAKMVRLAVDGVMGFSDMPLRVAIWFGGIISTLAFAYGFVVIVNWLLHSTMIEGWASTIVILSFLGGINLMTMGIVGLYVGRIYSQVKGRPLYLLEPLDDRLPLSTKSRSAGKPPVSVDATDH